MFRNFEWIPKCWFTSLGISSAILQELVNKFQKSILVSKLIRFFRNGSRFAPCSKEARLTLGDEALWVIEGAEVDLDSVFSDEQGSIVDELEDLFVKAKVDSFVEKCESFKARLGNTSRDYLPGIDHYVAVRATENRKAEIARLGLHLRISVWQRECFNSTFQMKDTDRQPFLCAVMKYFKSEFLKKSRNRNEVKLFQ